MLPLQKIENKYKFVIPSWGEDTLNNLKLLMNKTSKIYIAGHRGMVGSAISGELWSPKVILT